MAADDLFELFDAPPDTLRAGDPQSLDSISAIVPEQDAAVRQASLITDVDLKVDYSDYSNFVTFNSAYEYFTITGEQIVGHYPIDGTADDVLAFERELDGYQRYVLRTWPSRIGHMRFRPTVSSSYIKFDDVGLVDGVTKTSLLSPGTGSFSVQCWYESPASTGSNDALIIFQKKTTGNDGYWLFVSGSSLYFRVRSGSAIDEVSVPLGSGKSFVAATCDRTNQTGSLKMMTGSFSSFPVLVSSASLSFYGRLDLGSSSFYIGSGTVPGASTSKVTRIFTGSLDDVSVWSVARDVASLTGTYNRKLFAQDGLIAGWRFNESADISTANPLSALVKDCSGHRVDGRIQSYFGDIRGSGSLAYDRPDPILTLDDPNVLSYVNEQQTSGTVYDRNNSSKIIDLLPAAFSIDDSAGGAKLFKDFMFVVARNLDSIKLNIDQLSNFNRVQYGEHDQAPDALLSDVSKFYGWDPIESFSDATVAEYVAGLSVSTGSAANDALSTKLYDVKTALWKRTLLNLAHLYKTKGTRESVESLLRIYGLNKNHVRLKEYGRGSKRPLEARRIASDRSGYSAYFGTGSLSGSVLYRADYSDGSVRVDESFSVLTGTFSRPSGGAEFASAVGIPAAVPFAIWKCDEASGGILADTFNRVGLTSSLSTVAFAGAVATGLNDGDGTLTGSVAAENSPYATSFFGAVTSSLLDFTTGSIGIFGVMRSVPGGTGNLRGVVGKLNQTATAGYDVEEAGGVMYMRISDGGPSVDFNTGYTIADGGWHYFAAIWDRTANLARFISDKNAAVTLSISALTGSVTNPVDPFRLGCGRFNIFALGSQWAYAAVFTGSNAEALNNKTALDAWWTGSVGRHPDGWTYTRASTLGCQMGSGSAGAQVHVYSTGRFAHGWASHLEGNKLGMMSSPAVTNLLPWSDVGLTNGWGHSGSVTLTYGNDPRLVKNSVRIQKTGSADRLTTAVTLTAGTQYCFSVYTKSTSSIPFLRVMNSAGTTVMYAETSRSDNRPVVADSGWHQIFMRYTPSSTALYRFEALASTHSSSIGDAEFQYGQVNTGGSPMPLSFTIGSSAATAPTVMKRQMTAAERKGLGRKGVLRTRAQSHVSDAAAAAWNSSVGQDTSLARGRFLGIASVENAAAGVYTPGGVFVGWAITPSALSAQSLLTGSFWTGRWNEFGLDGTSTPMSVQVDSTYTTNGSAPPFTASLDPEYVYVGSISDQSGQWIGPVQRITLLDGISVTSASLQDHSVEIRTRWPTTASSPAASVTSGNLWSINLQNETETLRWERNSLGSSTGSLILELSNAALTMSSVPVFDDKWFNVAVVKNEVTGTYKISVKRCGNDGTVVWATSSLFTSASVGNFTAGQNLLSSVVVGSDVQRRSEQWMDQFRIWDISLEEEELVDHCSDYQSYGSSRERENYDLFIHWALDEGYAPSSGKIYHEDLSMNSRTGTGSWVDSSAPYDKFLNEYSYIASPEHGWNEDKISVHDSAEVPREYIGEGSRFISLEMNLIDALNEDIVHLMSSFDELNAIIGMPVNKYRESYDGLQQARETYFRRLQGDLNFRVFVDMLDFFDRTFVSLVKRLLPARAIFLGDEVIVESHMLERPKHQYQIRPVRDDLLVIEGGIQMYDRDDGDDV